MPGIATRGLTLPLVQHPAAQQKLYPHQAAILDHWGEQSAFLVVTKTGTGKTIGAVLPVLKHRQRAICVYPTNELVRDQVQNIRKVAEREGLRVCVQTAETSAEEYATADVILVHIDARALDAWRQKRHYREKWRALREMIEPDKPKIVLTNPDILFLIFGLRYHAEVLAALPGYQVLIVDEFHLYSGVELAHAFFMLHVGRSLGAFDKIVLLSATPEREVAEHLNRLLDNPMLITEGVECEHPVIGQRQAVHQVKIAPCPVGHDVVEAAVKVVKDLEPEIRRRRQAQPADDYVPAVVVVNSVVNAIRLEDRLYEERFQGSELAIIRGLSARDVRHTQGKLLAIGTSAIEVGIDFHCDYLIFEAGEASSFMQRFGRVGRHNPGVAYLLCPHNVQIGIDTLRQEKGAEVARGDLEERVYAWYPSLETRAWFTTTPLGLLSSFSLGENLIKRVRDDFRATPDQVETVEAQIEQFYASYAQRMGCPDNMLRSALRDLRKARLDGAHWLAIYRDLNTFRTSLPTEWVLDQAELGRPGRDWDRAKYTADIATLLRRAEGLHFSEKIPHPSGEMGMLVVKGYGRYKRVEVMPTFDDSEWGVLQCTSEYPDLHFVQEHHKTSVSHVMALHNHIFVVVPQFIYRDLDWRMPVFSCGQHLIAFDGAALLLCEIYNRSEKT